MNPAPPKPPSKNANRKALAAYFSQLRRWALALERWEADLDRREHALKYKQMLAEAKEIDQCYCHEGTCNIHPNQDYDHIDEIINDNGDTVVDDCGCTTEDAEDGCDCPPCENWRSQRAKQMMQRQQAAQGVGDEIQWLEELWQLPDKRKKK